MPSANPQKSDSYKEKRRFPWLKCITLLVLAAITAVLPGCGLFEGYAVEDYLKDVARIQYDSDTNLQNLDKQLESLSGDLKAVEETTAQLRADSEAVAATRMELEALDAPEAAIPLKGHLLELYTEGGSMLDELVNIGKYRLAIEPLIDQYVTSSSSFSQQLQGNSEKSEVINSLREYERSTAAILEKAQVIQPPLLSTSSHKQFLANLTTMSAGLSEMVAGLESGDTAALEAASDKMAGAGEVNDSLHQQINAEREADILGYNAKVQTMSELWKQIGQDQLELRERFIRQ